MKFRRTLNRLLATVAIMVTAGAIVGCATLSSTAAEGHTGFDLRMFAKPGFVVLEEDGRLWVFREGSSNLSKFQEVGELTKQVVRPKAGPGGVTLKSSDSATIDEYLTTLPGFFTQMENGRLWVFRAESPELEKFMKMGEPERQVVRPLSGPFGLTLKSFDTKVIDEYIAAWDAAKT